MNPLIPFVLALAIGAPDGPDPVRERADKLVTELGSPMFRIRERATKELLEMGFAAKEAVLAGQKSSDPEVAERCKKIYPEIFQRDLDRRIKEFLSSGTASKNADLPCAERWLTLVGDTRTSREQYAQMLQHHSRVLTRFHERPKESTAIAAEFAAEIYSQLTSAGTPTTGRPQVRGHSAMLYFFMGSDGPVRPSSVAPGLSTTHVYQFLNCPDFARMMTDAQEKTAARKVYVAWLDRERYPLLVRRGLDVAVQNDVKEAFPSAKRLAEDKTVTGYIRATGVLALGRLGTKNDLPFIESLMKDETLLANVNVNGSMGSVQIRDVALGAAVQLVGEKLANFSFERTPPPTLSAISSYTYYAFSSDDRRKEAAAKWRDWREKNEKKLDLPPAKK